MVANAQKRTVKRRQHPAGVTYAIMELARNEHLSAKAIARAVLIFRFLSCIPLCPCFTWATIFCVPTRTRYSA